MILRSIETQPESGVSHDPRIRKRVLLSAGELPHLTQFATSRIPPGDATSAHSHEDMTEMFLVQNGIAEVIIDGSPHSLKAGDYIVIQPNEVHILRNPSSEKSLDLLYFGIAD